MSRMPLSKLIQRKKKKNKTITSTHSHTPSLREQRGGTEGGEYMFRLHSLQHIPHKSANTYLIVYLINLFYCIED